MNDNEPRKNINIRDPEGLGGNKKTGEKSDFGERCE